MNAVIITMCLAKPEPFRQPTGSKTFYISEHYKSPLKKKPQREKGNGIPFPAGGCFFCKLLIMIARGVFHGWDGRRRESRRHKLPLAHLE